MKKITFLLLFIVVFFNSYSQVIVNITSVPCNTGLEGTYQYTYAGELDGSSTDWSCPNMYVSANAVSGQLEMLQDTATGIVTNVGTPPLNNVPKSALGCTVDSSMSAWTQDLTGKIAVVYRGSCQFGQKAWSAQMRGAIGLIIINHTGEPVGMLGGDYGTAVTIPVVMISRIAGDDLYTALQSCGGSITGFIGSKVGIYANDMGTTMGDVLMPNELAKPAYLSLNGTEFPIDLGFWAFNYGTNNQNGVTATVSVVKNSNGATIYTQTSLPLNFNSPSGNVIDSQYVGLGVCSPGFWNPGIYTINYSIDNLNDDDLSDNTFSFEFNLTGSFYSGSYTKSRTNVINEPISSTYRSLNETITQYDDWEACIVFQDANVENRFAYARGGIFSAMPVGTQMDFEIVEIRLYDWNDVFSDIDSPPTFSALTQVAQGLYYYDYSSNGNLSGQNISTWFDSPVYLINNKKYLFCVYTASDSIKIGFDEQINYKTTINHYKRPIAPVKLLPNGGSDSWNWEGFGPQSTPAIALNIETTTAIQEGINNTETIPYPNPASNLLIVPIRKKIEGTVLVEVFDLTGKLVLSENKTIGNEALKLNVSSISNGAYLFKLSFADGTSDQFKVSVNR